MASNTGIRVSITDRGDYARKPVLKDAAVYVAWATNLETILDGEDCWDIVVGTEQEPNELGWVFDPSEEEQAPAEAARAPEIKDWKKRFKRAASLITLSVDDSLVRILRVHSKNPSSCGLGRFQQSVTCTALNSKTRLSELPHRRG